MLWSLISHSLIMIRDSTHPYYN